MLNIPHCLIEIYFSCLNLISWYIILFSVNSTRIAVGRKYFAIVVPSFTCNSFYWKRSNNNCSLDNSMFWDILLMCNPMMLRFVITWNLFIKYIWINRKATYAERGSAGNLPTIYIHISIFQIYTLCFFFLLLTFNYSCPYMLPLVLYFVKWSFTLFCMKM